MGTTKTQRLRWRAALLLLFIFVLSAALSVGTYAAEALSRPGNTELAETERDSNSAASYYSGLNTSLQGNAFRAQLAELLKSTHKTYTSYDGSGKTSLAGVYKIADADPDKSGNIIWFYTGTSVSFSGFGSTSGTTNREHVWPKDSGRAFPAKTGPGSDGHHLRPTEATLNSSRGSKSYDEIAAITSNIAKQAGSISYGNLCYTNSTFFYPGEGYRGATARILMYMQVRWGDENGLTFVDSDGHCKTIGKISTLMKWHLEEPPTEEEIRRNEEVYAIQGNRNPFIDHPEYAEKIFCHDGKSYNDALVSVVNKYGNYTGAPATSIKLTPDYLELVPGQSATLSASVAPLGATSTVLWRSSNEDIVTVSGAGVVTARAAGSAVITAYSSDDASVCASVGVSVKAVSSITVTGTATKLTYTAGDRFDPTGLTVTATYTDGTTTAVPVADCLWLDSVTGSATLSEGTASVICKLGDIPYIYDGITVRAASAASITLTRDSFPSATGYAFNKWVCGSIEGEAYIYGGRKDCMQMNCTKEAYYIYNTTPLPAGLVSIKIRLNQATDDRQFELLTSATPYGQVDGCPEAGTSHGTKSSSASGDAIVWTLDGTDKYFSINYKSSSGAVYIASIEIGYGTSSGGSTDSVSLSETNVTIPDNGARKLTATASGSVIWASSDPSVASVDGEGNVTAHKAGTAIITATCGTATATCAVTVTRTSADVVSISEDRISLDEGETKKLTATASGNIAWSSGDTTVATVDGEGNVTAKKAGTVIITATCGDASDTCIITVNAKEKPPAPDGEITIVGSDKVSVRANGSLTLTVDGEGALTWTTSDPSIATIDENGKLIAKKAGQVTVTVSNGASTVTYTVDVDYAAETCKDGEHAFGDWQVYGSGKYERHVCGVCGEAEIRTANADGGTGIGIDRTVIIVVACTVGVLIVVCAVSVIIIKKHRG